MLAKIFFFTLALTSCLVASQIVRPCALSDYGCIRQVLSQNSYCNPNVVGSIANPVRIAQRRFEEPYFNATYFDNNLVIGNWNRCRVSEFYANTARRILVLALDCPQMIFASNRLLIQHISLKEDQFYRYSIRSSYPLIRLTTNFYYQNGLDLCSSFTFADVTALPTYAVSPNNPLIQSFLNPRTIFERELFFWRAPLLARTFINSRLCNFGCNS